MAPDQSAAVPSATQAEPQGQHRAEAKIDDDVAAILASGRVATAAASECVRAAGVVVQRHLIERPYVSVGVAAGVGFLVAGGFASPMGKSLLRLGTRFAFGAATRQLTTLVIAALSKPPVVVVVVDAPADLDVV
ncbi:MAG: hypothetical protein Q8O67_15335 [Deltaproteobacteria bacterium]|nr:hypothetical protein [Deltaproteobacteria bacterium]